MQSSRIWALGFVLLTSAVAFALGLWSSGSSAAASACDDPEPEWLVCEDFEDGGAGWRDWFAASPWVECNGCSDGVNDPGRIRLVEDPEIAHTGQWALHMPAEESAGYRGGALTWRDCVGEKRPGCRLRGHERLHFRAHVRLAEDHGYVHHFLAVSGTQPDRYWDSDGNAGCRPNGERWAGTTLDFNRERELFFYTYFPDMRCDSGGYCSGDRARQICEGCARKNMPCSDGPECCWGNHFGPETPVVLPRGRWVCLEIGMQLNTPGRADGHMSFWVDGELAHREEGMRWRDIESLQLNKAWLQHYIAGGDAERSNRIWFDDVVVSTERIGCGSTAAATPTGRPSPTAEATDETPPPTAPPTPTPAGTSATATPTPPAPVHFPALGADG